jgi:hypothetical protein
VRVGERCQTVDGPGRVLAIVNATRWQPAWVTVQLDSGSTKVFRGGEVRDESDLNCQ